jgi:very-short-patch-repair endonuclease
MGIDEIDLPKNVRVFVEKAADEVRRSFLSNFPPLGRQEPDDELFLESPIEFMFYAAFRALMSIHKIPDYQDMFSFCGTNENPSTGMIFEPRYECDQYRVDFYCCLLTKRYYYGEKRVLVELDGHEFHERTEEERRYEKQRDRFFNKNGYIIFHYTGKEVTDDPFVPAAEVLSYLTEKNIDPHIEV